MSKSFYKALQQAMGLVRQNRYHWKKNGVSPKGLRWLAEHADCSTHEGQFFLTFKDQDHPVTESLYAQVKHLKDMEQIRRKTL